MPQLPDLIHLAIPAFIGLLVLEAVLDAIMRREIYEFKDTAASLTMGIGNVLLGLLNKAMVFAIFTAVHRFAIFKIGYQWWAWLILFLADDFTYYWFHRVSHECRLFWASHFCWRLTRALSSLSRPPSMEFAARLSLFISSWLFAASACRLC